MTWSGPHWSRRAQPLPVYFGWLDPRCSRSGSVGRIPSLNEFGDGWLISGEGRWTVLDAIDKDVALPVIALSLFTRFRSRVDPEGSGSFAKRLLAALSNEFGGHAVVENRG